MPKVLMKDHVSNETKKSFYNKRGMPELRVIVIPILIEVTPEILLEIIIELLFKTDNITETNTD
jgi:hypothetical protein